MAFIWEQQHQQQQREVEWVESQSGESRQQHQQQQQEHQQDKQQQLWGEATPKRCFCFGGTCFWGVHSEETEAAEGRRCCMRLHEQRE